MFGYLCQSSLLTLGNKVLIMWALQKMHSMNKMPPRYLHQVLSRWLEQTLVSASQRCSGHTFEWIGYRGFQWFLPPAGRYKSLLASAKCHFACLEKGCLSSCVQWTGSLAILGGNSQVGKKSNWSPKRGSLGRKEEKHHSPQWGNKFWGEPTNKSSVGDLDLGDHN